ncbi:MAG: hypothetical protein SVP26_01895, partial [Chloroflexota bacterium]|nr:hypothetical protein [Chloroflexota bacterium]
MPLDLAQVAAQIEGLAARLRAEEKSRAERITGALRLLESVDAGSLKEKIDASTTTWESRLMPVQSKIRRPLIGLATVVAGLAVVALAVGLFRGSF